MARGRMLSKCLSVSERFASLYDRAGPLAEFCQILFTLLVAHADDFGRLPGDEFTVRYQVLPASPRPMTEFGEALGHLHDSGLILWYVVDDRKYIQIQQFDEHQTGLHKRVKSKIPEPSGKFPEIPGDSRLTKQKRTELKRTKPIEPGPAKEQPDGRVKEFLTWFQAEYATRRHGAEYFIQWRKDAPTIKRLLKVYPPERLQRHAKILLTTDDDWIDRTDRGIGIFATKINWLEERLATWEATHARAVQA